MKTTELLTHVLAGRLLIVGQYRGSRAELKGYSDQKSGGVIHYIRAVHLLECACGGNLDRAVIYEKLPEFVETPEEAVFPYAKGRLYVFFLASVKWDNGQVIGFLSERSPAQLDLDDSGSE